MKSINYHKHVDNNLSKVLYIILYCITFVSIVGVDRFTKMWTLYNAHNPAANSFLPSSLLNYISNFLSNFLSYELVFNRGISWGLFNSSSSLVFMLITILIMSVTIILGIYTYQRYKLNYSIWGEILVLAGSCSNIIDRFLYGGVVDFIVVHIPYFSYPAFNIADSAIVIGVLIMFIKYNKNRA